MKLSPEENYIAWIKDTIVRNIKRSILVVLKVLNVTEGGQREVGGWWTNRPQVFTLRIQGGSCKLWISCIRWRRALKARIVYLCRLQFFGYLSTDDKTHF